MKAGELLAANSTFDFAASRANYAMFYAAQAALLIKGLKFNSHAAVISAFGRQFSKTELVPPQLHRYLISAEKTRLVGDYDASDDVTAEEARGHLRAAEFIHAIESLLRG